MFLVVMGVSGSGKSTLAKALADALGWNFLEGDDLHAQVSIDRMRAGIALDDDDRWPWLDSIVDWMRQAFACGRQGVVACSALKRSYRDRLRQGGDVRFVYLRVPLDELQRRIDQRSHFMPASLLDSQMETLQEPDVEERAWSVCSETTEQQIREVCRWIEH